MNLAKNETTPFYKRSPALSARPSRRCRQSGESPRQDPWAVAHQWDGAQPTPNVASRLLDIPGHARSGRACPAVHPPGRQRHECAAVQPAGQRRPADLLLKHQNLASASNQRQIMLAPIAAVTVESCKSQVLRNKVPKNHLSESTYATKIGFLIRSG